MLEKLKYLLNSYSYEELKVLDLWINSNETIKNIVVDCYGIDLITENFRVDIKLDKE